MDAFLYVVAVIVVSVLIVCIGYSCSHRSSEPSGELPASSDPPPAWRAPAANAAWSADALSGAAGSLTARRSTPLDKVN